jgi:TP901 family phage tail tape measure protein
MSSVTATINVQINAANAAAQLTALQGKVAAMNKGMLAATAGGVMAQEKAIKRMGNVLGSSGMFTTGIRNVHTELGRMHKEFDRGSTTLQHYRQNSKMWGKDHSAINRLAADRVRMLQSQYVALGKEMNGVQKAMQIKPTGMMREFGADAMYATQQQMLFRRNLQMGSTALVNWGKNTQWAGRQMMVGMGIPIALVAAGAIKSFNDIEKSSIAFKRVYGDTTTTVAEKSQMLAKVQQTVGKEMLKYGVSMADTLDMSARAAATGAKGADLIAATRETMRLATLGNMDYNKSLDAVIAMQTAFNIKSSDMAKTTDFLNAVENQTILSMQDMAVAVPRVAPVIKGLGGNVQDLAVMMTALRQGGVSAEQGANALKSGLGSLLNPTSTAIKQFDGLGINLQKIVDTNKGDIIGTLQGLGKALDGLTKYDRQRALEGLFGKYQYSRMGALLKNINSKAAKETMKLAKTNAGELARMSNQELSQISDSPMIKLKAAIEGIKAAAAPLGAVLSDIAAKIVNIATPIVSFFSNNDIAKWALIGTAGIAALAGTFTMVVGVLANFAGSMVKAGMSVKNFFRIITGRGSLAYITSEELEASAAANSLATAAERAGQGLMAESRAAQLLTSQLNALSAAQLKAAGSAGALASAPTALQAASRQAGHASYPITNQKALASLLAADPQRGHIGGTRPLSVDEILALPTPSARNKTAAALVAKAKAEAEAFKADTTGTVPAPTLYGKSNMTLVQEFF